MPRIPDAIASPVKHITTTATARKPDAPLELFDLRTDLHEDHDIAAEHPEVVARIKAYLATCRTDVVIPGRKK